MKMNQKNKKNIHVSTGILAGKSSDLSRIGGVDKADQFIGREKLPGNGASATGQPQPLV